MSAMITIVTTLINMGCSSRVCGAQDGEPGGGAGEPRGAGVSEGSARPGSVLEGVLGLGPGLLVVTLAWSRRPSARTPVACGPPCRLLEGAFDCLGLMRNLPGDTHEGCPSSVVPGRRRGRRGPRRPGRPGAQAVRRGRGRGPGWPAALAAGRPAGERQAREQAGPAQARIAAVPGGAVVAQRAGGVGAGGVALASQFVAVLADGGGLPARLPEALPCCAASPRGAAPRRPAAGSARPGPARR